MLSLFEHLIFWHWLGIAAILLIFEVVTGSGFLLWLSLSAALTGIWLWWVPELSWATQLLGFTVLAMVSTAGWWLYLKLYPRKKNHRSTLNRRGEQQIGRIFILDAPIVNGMGKVRVDDSIWRVRGPDLPAGARIKIIAIDGIILIAEKEG